MSMTMTTPFFQEREDIHGHGDHPLFSRRVRVTMTISSFSQIVVGGDHGNHLPHKGVEIKLGQFKCKPCQMEKAWYEAL